MPMCIMLEYSSNYSDLTVTLCFYSTGESIAHPNWNQSNRILENAVNVVPLK